MSKGIKQLLIFFIILQTVSLFNMLSSGNLNGDYSAFNVDYFWLIVSYVFSFFPYLILVVFLSKQSDSNKFTISNIKYFNLIVILILIFNIFFSVVYKVGLYAQSQIYSVPIFLKPLVVLLNKFDTYTMVALLLMSSNFKKRIKVTAVLLLIALALSRASIIVFLFLFLVLIGSGKVKFKLLRVIIIYIVFTFSFQFLPKLFEFREKLRNGATENKIDLVDSKELNDFMKSKIIGRVSGLSSIAYFYQNHDAIEKSINDVGDYEYIIECFRPFYGGIIRENKIGYTYYFTNLYDNYAGTDYGIMYGLPSVMLLSYFKGIHVLIINMLFIMTIIYFIVRLCAYLFSNIYKEISFIILFYPLTSGVSAEFGLQLLYLLFLAFLKILYVSYKKSKNNSDDLKNLSKNYLT